MPSDAKRIHDLFLQLVELPAADRSEALEQECGSDAELQHRVTALLKANDDPDSYKSRLDESVRATLDFGASGAESAATVNHTEGSAGSPDSDVRMTAGADYHRGLQAGAVIADRYTLQEKIGEGGMGEVWVAMQTEPVKRKVALKLIKPGMNSKAVLGRFEQERQALAMMDHPNIARVLDGGLTSTGQPFFVMELVNGLSLTKFCDEGTLGVRERMELYVSICQAVQHAHQKGVVHRDLKPANILVAVIDGRPFPKVIDFGVAKAIGGKLADESMSTQFGAVVGTLEYMAPEQAGFSGIDVDTRADIYSLGVILYELVTGLRPIDAARLKKVALTKIVRIIHEEEPSKPSTRLSTDKSLPSLAALRQMEPKKLIALLRGELDWIVMKCLEKQRERRYETVNALGRDIERYLADEPVEARPPSTLYRIGKFMRRNKGQVIAATFVLLVLVAGILGTSIGLVRAEQARAGERDRAEGERLAKEQAQKRLAQIEKANGILGSIFECLEPTKIASADRPLQAILVEHLDKAVQQLESEAIGDALVVAIMQNRLGWSLLGLGETQKAIVLLEKARPILQDELGGDHPHTFINLHNLAVAYQAAGLWHRAVALHKITLMDRKRTLGGDHPHTLKSMGALAAAYGEAGKPELAVPLLKEALQLRNAKFGPEHPETLSTLGNLASAYFAAGKLHSSLAMHEETLAARKKTLGPEHPDTLISMSNLATAYGAMGKRELAVSLLEETVELHRRTLGPDHPNTLHGQHRLAGAYASAKHFAKSIPLFNIVLERRTVTLGRNHPDTLQTIANLGASYVDAGRTNEALLLLAEAYQAAKDHRACRLIGPILLEAHVKNRNVNAAVALARELVDKARATQSQTSHQFAAELSEYGRLLLDGEAFAEAERLLCESLTIRERALADHWVTSSRIIHRSFFQ